MCLPRLDGTPIAVIGAGVAGLTAATALSERGAQVTVYERSHALGQDACSWLAGGMLAPYCERDGADELVSERGRMALDWWPHHVPAIKQCGSLVVTAARDRAELARFASRRKAIYGWMRAPLPTWSRI